jgi:Fuc2NAc and GlcNAc transferase
MMGLLLAVLLLSCAFTGWIRRYCLSHGIIDVPNQRSSHTRIVARGGGIGFSFIFLVAILALGVGRVIPSRVAIGFAGGGSLIALTGWIDDRKGLTQLSRIVLHLLSAAWAVAWIGPVPPLSVGSISWNWGWIGQLVGVIAIAWMVNLYNFMDGTDGIAAVEAVTVALLAAALCSFAGLAATGHVYWLLASAVAGFLFWNWPPARIVMGDAGSGFLGFTFAALTLWCWAEDVRLLWPCAILLSVFIADATTTLLRRMMKGERWYEPHRTHAYQKLALRVGHRPIALGVATINVLVLGPAAWLAWLHPNLGFPLILSVNAVFAIFILTIRDSMD